MVRIVSFINLKGGVGKTTLTVNIASVLAKVYNKKVLLIDLDPQTNATVSLISQEDWQRINDVEKQTLFHLFNDKLNGTNNFDIKKAILKNVADIKNLDLLPSSLNLVEIQDEIPNMPSRTFINHIDVIKNEVQPILNSYDYILIDCPPNLGAITLNGIVFSQHYIIPTTPDILSKIGISIIEGRINNFKLKRKDCHINLAGLVFTKVDERTNLHGRTRLEMRDPSYHLQPHVFHHEMPLRISIAEAPENNRPHITSPIAKTKRDYHDTQKLILDIVDEFLTKIP